MYRVVVLSGGTFGDETPEILRVWSRHRTLKAAIARLLRDNHNADLYVRGAVIDARGWIVADHLGRAPSTFA